MLECFDGGYATQDIANPRVRFTECYSRPSGTYTKIFVNENCSFTRIFLFLTCLSWKKENFYFIDGTLDVFIFIVHKVGHELNIDKYMDGFGRHIDLDDLDPDRRYVHLRCYSLQVDR